MYWAKHPDGGSLWQRKDVYLMTERERRKAEKGQAEALLIMTYPKKLFPQTRPVLFFSPSPSKTTNLLVKPHSTRSSCFPKTQELVTKSSTYKSVKDSSHLNYNKATSSTEFLRNFQLYPQCSKRSLILPCLSSHSWISCMGSFMFTFYVYSTCIIKYLTNIIDTYVIL